MLSLSLDLFQVDCVLLRFRH